MASSYGDFYRGNLLRDEVLYLHGLWKQGSHPPSPGNGNFNSNTKCNLTPSHLRPRFSGKLRKGRKHQRRRKKAVASEKEWPCDPDTDPIQAVATGWPEPRPKPEPRPPSAEDLAAALVARAQKNGVDACRRFFSKKIVDNDSDECDSAGELEEDDDDEEEEVEEWAFKIFMDIFTKDNELRRYYEENHDKGEFLCLVCEGSGAKKGRTFGDCAGLVQHCSNAAKIGPKAAHRGLARALCRVVGWNFERLPMLVLDLEETLGQMLARDASG
ncbi:uncharacterized protein LOC110022377 [Phalaenopsis equestris]|uniref:uncharacterized protein LOC110022377 n=1 Tax=Phalaenopsis equestris TaxID=78828 RepID=UPI0009E3699A|nr:uncharacterized protein LOC110022377 [Phalaenopsis equestris]XP_020576930.1 uncharacterized protein LOC110022377 [Phalaenopsis equestris]XP_020576931.1 uncharacterized protein LOC110022377 [Phalaenopsis equestris]XP_020576933.1 uncharacterized protein LOC110022377 [Phalaenopsis equestris]